MRIAEHPYVYEHFLVTFQPAMSSPGLCQDSHAALLCSANSQDERLGVA